MTNTLRSPIFVLTFIVAVAVLLLTAVDLITRERIAAAEIARIRSQLVELFPEMDAFEIGNHPSEWSVIQDGSRVGQASRIVAAGYGGPIVMLLGIEMDGTVRGLRIISQQETPGLGSRIAELSFLSRFSGISAQDALLSRHGGAIDAITSATVSSSAVVDSVRKTLRDLELLGGRI